MNRTLKRALRNSRINSEYFTRKKRDEKQKAEEPTQKEDKK